MRMRPLIVAALCAFTTVANAEDPGVSFSAPVIVASGFKMTEGPVWDTASATLIFSDIPGNTIYAFDPASGEKQVWRSPSDNSNGLALDTDGYLLAAEQRTRMITRIDPETRASEPLIESVEIDGSPHRLNSPNDIAVHASGTVYFTDPPFGIRRHPERRELPFNGVFARRPDGTVVLVKQFPEDVNPNGIVFDAKQTRLYLAVSDDETGPIYVFDVDSEGGVSNERVFAEGRNNDGMAVDMSGNLFVANRTGVKVFDPEGAEIAFIVLPGSLRTTNVAFGGPDGKTLFITNRSRDLYAVSVE